MPRQDRKSGRTVGGRVSRCAVLAPPVDYEALLGELLDPATRHSDWNTEPFPSLSAAAVIGHAAREDPKIELALLAATKDASGRTPLRRALWSALVALGTDEAIDRLKRDYVHMLGADDIEWVSLETLGRLLVGAAGPGVFEQLLLELPHEPKRLRVVFENLAGGDFKLARRLEATRSIPSAENFRLLRYALSWSGQISPSPSGYRAALLTLDDMAQAGPPEVRSRAISLIDQALLEQPIKYMGIRSAASRRVPLDRVPDEYRPLAQLKSLEEDVAAGRIHIVHYPRTLRDLFSDVVRLEEIPRSWLEEEPRPVEVQLVRTARSVRLIITNQSESPVAINPTSLRYGRTRLWECEKTTEGVRSRWVEMYVSLGSIVSPHQPTRPSVDAGDLVVIAPGRIYEMSFATPENTPRVIRVDFWDHFAVRGPLPAPLLIEFHARTK